MTFTSLFHITWILYSHNDIVHYVGPLFSFSLFCSAENHIDALEEGVKQPLLVTSEPKEDEDADQDYDDSEEATEESRKPANSLRSAYRLLTPSVKVCGSL